MPLTHPQSSQLHLGLWSGRETAAGARRPKSAAQHRSRLKGSALPAEARHRGARPVPDATPEHPYQGDQPCSTDLHPLRSLRGLGPLLQPAVPHPRVTISQQPCKQLCHLQPCGGNLVGGGRVWVFWGVTWLPPVISLRGGSHPLSSSSPTLPFRITHAG